jgi:PEP-CTERM motif
MLRLVKQKECQLLKSNKQGVFMINFAKLSCVFLLAVLLFSVDVKADPIQIISGSLNLDGRAGITNSGAGEFLSFNFAGQNLAASGGNRGDNNGYPIVGSRFDIGTVLPVTSNFTLSNVIGNAALNGGNYPTSLYFLNPSSLTFTAAPVTVPQIPNGQNILTLSVPFTANGFFTLQCAAGISGCATPSLVEFFGTGLAEYTFINNVFGFPAAATFVSNIRYTFTGTTPTPEPATLFLTGAGLAGIIGYARKRRKKQAE